MLQSVIGSTIVLSACRMNNAALNAVVDSQMQHEQHERRRSSPQQYMTQEGEYEGRNLDGTDTD